MDALPQSVDIRKAEYQKDDFTTEMPTVPEGEFCVFGTVYAYPHHADALEDIYAQLTHLAAAEPGVLYYCIARDGEARSVFHFFERYTGREAFEKHNQLPLVRKLFKERVFEGVKARFVEAIGGKEVGSV